MLAKRFRKDEVLLHLPLIINSEDQPKTTKMEPKKILESRSIGVKVFDISKGLAFDRAARQFHCPLL